MTLSIQKPNPGFYRTKVANMELEVRLATMADLGEIIKLINKEHYNTHFIESLLKARNAEAVHDIITRILKGEVDIRRPKDPKIVEILRQFTDDMVKETSTTVSLDATNARDIAEAIQNRLSVVATIDGNLAGHMCAYNLERFTQDKRMFEITHGIVDPQYRDGSGIPADSRKNVQNRTRFAMLHELSNTSVDPLNNTIISITRQPKVAGPLEWSGFKTLELGTGIGDYILRKLEPVVWSHGWTARYATISDWKGHCEQNNISTVDDYNNHISAKQAEAKLRK